MERFWRDFGQNSEGGSGSLEAVLGISVMGNGCSGYSVMLALFSHLGASWGRLGVSRAHRGAILGHLGRVLGRFGVGLGTSWNVLGAFWEMKKHDFPWFFQ